MKIYTILKLAYQFQTIIFKIVCAQNYLKLDDFAKQNQPKIR